VCWVPEETGNPLKAPEKTIENLPTLIDREVFPGTQGGPHMNNILAKAVAFGEALDPSFQVYANQILKNAKQLADELMKRGFKLVSNGTDNHLIMIDMHRSFGIDGRVTQEIFDRVGLTGNCNAIPNDTLPPFRPSGFRLGTPAITSRGLVESDMAFLAEQMQKAINSKDSESQLDKIKADVTAFALQFPLPSDK
jgi:glycine hydroxymethyltransferase